MYHGVIVEDNFQEPVLFFNHVGPGDQTQVVWFGHKHLYLCVILSAHMCKVWSYRGGHEKVL